MKYSEEELKTIIEKEFKNNTFEITETENWIKIKDVHSSMVLGKGLKEQFKEMLKQEFEK